MIHGRFHRCPDRLTDMMPPPVRGGLPQCQQACIGPRIVIVLQGLQDLVTKVLGRQVLAIVLWSLPHVLIGLYPHRLDFVVEPTKVDILIHIVVVVVVVIVVIARAAHEPCLGQAFLLAWLIVLSLLSNQTRKRLGRNRKGARQSDERQQCRPHEGNDEAVDDSHCIKTASVLTEVKLKNKKNNNHKGVGNGLAGRQAEGQPMQAKTKRRKGREVAKLPFSPSGLCYRRCRRRSSSSVVSQKSIPAATPQPGSHHLASTTRPDGERQQLVAVVEKLREKTELMHHAFVLF